MDKFTLVNKDRSRIKVFEPFEDVSKPSPSIDAMMISYGCVYKRSSKPVMKGSSVQTIEEARKEYKGMIINAAGFTHTSVAIRDALNLFKKPIIELHISNIYKREEFRHKSLISDIATGGIFGLGTEGYILAIISIQKIIENENR